MALSIELSDKKKIWNPGDEIVGVLVLKPYKQINVQRVEIGVEGIIQSAKTPYELPRAGFAADIRLFRKTEVLFRGPYTVAAAQEWPFTLQLPEDCRGVKKRSFPHVPENIPWDDTELSKPLPPSTYYGTPEIVNSAERYSSVQYWISAEVFVPGLHTNIEKQMRLELMPFREESIPNPVPEYMEVSRQRFIRSLHLDPEIGDRELRLKEKFKKTFSSKDVPGVHYDLVTEFPDQGIVGEAPHISLSVRPPKAAASEKLPQVKLKSLALHVVRKVRYLGTARVIDQGQYYDESQIARWSGTMVIDGKLDLRTLYQHRQSDWARVVPDFCVFHLSEQHALKLKIGIEVARQSHEVIIPSPPFKMHSPYYRSADGSSLAAPLCDDPYGLTAADAMEGDPDLPPYKEQIKE